MLVHRKEWHSLSTLKYIISNIKYYTSFSFIFHSVPFWERPQLISSTQDSQALVQPQKLPCLNEKRYVPPSCQARPRHTVGLLSRRGPDSAISPPISNQTPTLHSFFFPLLILFSQPPHHNILTEGAPPFKPPNMAQSTAHRRLLQEYRALTNNPPEGITAGPVSEDDLLHWECLIQGPEGTPFEGGVFPAELKFPKDYPLAPPSMKFLADMWHPNGMSIHLYIFSPQNFLL